MPKFSNLKSQNSRLKTQNSNPNNMTTTFTEENNNYVMRLEGRLDTSASSQAEREMQVLYNCAGHDIILDCSGLEYISSSGLRIFLAVLKNANKNKSKVTIKGMNDDLRQVFDEIGFTNLFHFE